MASSTYTDKKGNTYDSKTGYKLTKSEKESRGISSGKGSSNNSSKGSSSSYTPPGTYKDSKGNLYDSKTGYKLTKQEIDKRKKTDLSQANKERILREDEQARKIEEQIELESKTGSIKVEKTKRQTIEKQSIQSAEQYSPERQTTTERVEKISDKRFVPGGRPDVEPDDTKPGFTTKLISRVVTRSKNFIEGVTGTFEITKPGTWASSIGTGVSKMVNEEDEEIQLQQQLETGISPAKKRFDEIEQYEFSAKDTLIAVDLATGNVKDKGYTQEQVNTISEEITQLDTELTKKGEELSTRSEKLKAKKQSLDLLYSDVKDEDDWKNYQKIEEAYNQDVMKIQADYAVYQSQYEGLKDKYTDLSQQVNIANLPNYLKQVSGVAPSDIRKPTLTEKFDIAFASAESDLKSDLDVNRNLMVKGRKFSEFSSKVGDFVQGLKEDLDLDTTTTYTTRDNLPDIFTGDVAITQTKGTRILGQRPLDVAQSVARTGERIGTSFEEKPFESSLVVGSIGVAIASLPLSSAGIVGAPLIGTLSAGYAMRKTTTGLGEDYVYGRTTKRGRELIDEGFSENVNTAIRAEDEAVGGSWISPRQLYRAIPYSELTGYGSEVGAFQQNIRQQLIAQGVTNEWELREQTQLAMQLRKAKAIESGTQLIATEVISEMYGGAIKRGFTAYDDFVNVRKSTWDTTKYVLSRTPTYAQVGFGEGFTGTYIERQRTGRKGDVGEALFWGGIGAGTASVIGGIIDYNIIKSQPLQTAPARTARYEFVDKSGTLYDIPDVKGAPGVLPQPGSKIAKARLYATKAFAYISDPAEGPGDFIAGGVDELFGGFSTPSIGSSTTSKTSSKTTSNVKTKDIAPITKAVTIQNVNTQFKAPAFNAPVNIGTQNLTEQQSKTLQKSTISNQITQPSNTFSSNIPALSQSPSLIQQPTLINNFSNVQQTTDVNVNTNTNVWTSNFGFPLGWDRGTRGKGGRTKKPKKQQGYQRSFGASLLGITSEKQARDMFGSGLVVETRKRKGGFSLLGIRI